MIIAIASMLMNFSSGEASPSIERALQWAIEIAKDPAHGYSQGAENATPENPYTGSREGPDYDCSSLVYHSLEHGGFKIIEAWRRNPKYLARYQGRQFSGDADTIWMDLKKIGGWKKFSWDKIKDNLKRGDILCIPKKHVAFYIGDGQTVEARGVNNPRGGSYETGDQGGEIDIYESENRGWTEVYRYIGKLKKSMNKK